MKPVQIPLLLFLAPLIAGLPACDALSAASSPHPYEGIWDAPAYGTLRVIRKDRISSYQYTRDYCLLADREKRLSLSDLTAMIRLDDNGRSMTFPLDYGVSSFHIPPAVYTRRETLPDSCVRPVPTKGQRGYREDFSRDFDLFWQTFDELSVAFHKVDVDWPALRTRYDRLAAKAHSEAALLEILFNLTRPLADGHVQLSAPGIGQLSANGKPVQQDILLAEYMAANQRTDPVAAADTRGFRRYRKEQLDAYEAIIRAYADNPSDIETGANGLITWFTIDGTVYVNLRSLSGFSGSEDDNAANLEVINGVFDDILARVNPSDGLVLDIRANGCGDDFLGLAIARRFVDARRHVMSKQARLGTGRTPLQKMFITPSSMRNYTGRVVLLTSNSTFSAAETFALAMRSLPNVTLIGEPTQGALSDLLEKRLPSRIRFTLSNEYYLDPGGDWFEGRGIPVDLHVPTFTLGERRAQKDHALETAVTWLKRANLRATGRGNTPPSATEPSATR